LNAFDNPEIRREFQRFLTAFVVRYSAPPERTSGGGAGPILG
jgi:hypothetical protein